MLSMYIWDRVDSSAVTPQMRYWADFWNETSEGFATPSSGSRLESPRLLAGDLIDEIEFNGLRNDRVKKYFVDAIQVWCKQKIIIGPACFVHMQLLQSAIHSEPHEYIVELCDRILGHFNSGDFFREALARLVELLLGDKSDDRTVSEIECLSRLLIVEFIERGYGHSACAKFPSNVFDWYHVFPGNGAVTTKFPVAARWEDVQHHHDATQAYRDALVSEIESLTVRQRLESLVRYFDRPISKHRFIFPLEGVRGDGEVSLGDVSVYDPRKKKYVISGDFGGEASELFRRQEPYVFSNATVVVAGRDSEDAQHAALMKIESALDLLGFYRSSKVAPEVRTENHLVVSEDGRLVGSRSSQDRRSVFWAWEDALDLTETWSQDEESKLKKVASRLLDSGVQQLGFAERQAAAGLHWFRKAQHSKHLEDKLVSFWIVLEKMFAESGAGRPVGREKISSILSIVPSMFAHGAVFGVGWELLRYLRILVGSKHGDRALLSVPAEVVEGLHLKPKPGQVTHLRDFVAGLPRVLEHTDRKIVRDKIAHVVRFYSDGIYAERSLRAILRDVELDLLLIYRYRNKIVHDAHFSDRMISYFVGKASVYSGDCLSRVLRTLGGARDVWQIGFEAKVRVDEVLKRLVSGQNFTLLDFQAVP